MNCVNWNIQSQTSVIPLELKTAVSVVPDNAGFHTVPYKIKCSQRTRHCYRCQVAGVLRPESEASPSQSQGLMPGGLTLKRELRLLHRGAPGRRNHMEPAEGP